MWIVIAGGFSSVVDQTKENALMKHRGVSTGEKEAQLHSAEGSTESIISCMLHLLQLIGLRAKAGREDRVGMNSVRQHEVYLMCSSFFIHLSITSLPF